MGLVFARWRAQPLAKSASTSSTSLTRSSAGHRAGHHARARMQNLQCETAISHSPSRPQHETHHLQFLRGSARAYSRGGWLEWIGPDPATHPGGAGAGEPLTRGRRPQNRSRPRAPLRGHPPDDEWHKPETCHRGVRKHVDSIRNCKKKTGMHSSSTPGRRVFIVCLSEGGSKTTHFGGSLIWRQTRCWSLLAEPAAGVEGRRGFGQLYQGLASTVSHPEMALCPFACIENSERG